MSEVIIEQIYFWWSQNPSFCPSKFQDGMSMDDRFKKSRGCLRPCTCYECKNLYIDRAIRTPQTLGQIIGDKFRWCLTIFLNWSIVWGLAATILFGLSVTYFPLNIPFVVGSGAFSLLFAWIIWKTTRFG